MNMKIYTYINMIYMHMIYVWLYNDLYLYKSIYIYIFTHLHVYMHKAYI